MEYSELGGTSRLYFGPLLFHVFMGDMFLSVERFSSYNYADDNKLILRYRNANI